MTAKYKAGETIWFVNDNMGQKLYRAIIYRTILLPGGHYMYTLFNARSEYQEENYQEISEIDGSFDEEEPFPECMLYHTREDAIDSQIDFWAAKKEPKS